MPYEIGRAFSDAVLNSIDRARDRAAAHPAEFTRRPITSLREAMIRAEQDQRENEVRRELGLATIDANRERYAAADATDRADLARKTAADEATGEYHQGLLDQQASNAEDLNDYRSGVLTLREQEGADRATRYRQRGEYEKGVLGVRTREADRKSVV